LQTQLGCDGKRESSTAINIIKHWLTCQRLSLGSIDELGRAKQLFPAVCATSHRRADGPANVTPIIQQ
ncbi:TPA: hypothetical protein ACYLN4_002762, partial [Burkholderia lata]